ncbi:MAG TPA: hypothetical protein VJP02_25615 [Candidatus Sulfotelmatobacter sp.]|nr:hypothetical protein [Candidatus Sulfotelmatobacter sp.]
MCYNTAAAAKAGAIQALRSGILVLLIPPVLIFGAVCVFALKNQNRCNDDDEAADDSPPFLVDGFPEYRLARDVPSAEAR